MLLRSFLAALLLSTVPALAEVSPPATSKKAPVLVGDIDTDINGVTASFIARLVKEAESTGAPFLVLRLNTPGGRLDSTREITQTILSSKVPVVGFVTPSGAQAASAGFLVLMACDVAAMAPGTNTGAATPVGGGGEELPKTISKKVTEDASALLRSLTTPRGRPSPLAVQAITESLSFSESESLEKKLVELVARDLSDLYRQMDGRAIKRVGKPDSVLRSAGAESLVRKMTALQKALGVIANPALAGILFLIGLVGLYSEMSHPGAVLPGVLGGICLLLALFAMSVLPTNYAGVGLMLLGVLFFFLEVKIASHGLFAIGGAVAIILGAVLLFHQNELALNGEFWFIVAGAGTTALILALLSFKALMTQRLPDRTGAGVLLGLVVPAQTEIHATGKVFADGALWEARSESPIGRGELVEIVGLEGLSVIVRPKARG